MSSSSGTGSRSSGSFCNVFALVLVEAGLDGRRAVLKTSRRSCCKEIGIVVLKLREDFVDWELGGSSLRGCFGGWRVRCDWD